MKSFLFIPFALATQYNINLDALTPDNENEVHLLNLHVGDTVTVQAHENPSTGYTWQISEGELGVWEAPTSEFVSDNDSETMVGVGGDRIFTFSIVGTGKETLLMDYARSWEFTGFDQENLLGVYQVHFWSN